MGGQSHFIRTSASNDLKITTLGYGANFTNGRVETITSPWTNTGVLVPALHLFWGEV